jgi:sortase A
MTATAPQPNRTRTRRALRMLANVLIVGGALLLADAILTVLWQEPVSSIYAHVQQGKLQHRLDTLEATPLAPVEKRAIARLPDDTTRLAFAARAFARRTQPGDPIGRIRLKSAGIDDVMVEGTDGGDLRQGPGHYPATPLPGESGTVGVAGHRTTYGAPFRHIDGLKPGDKVTLAIDTQRGERKTVHLTLGEFPGS